MHCSQQFGTNPVHQRPQEIWHKQLENTLAQGRHIVQTSTSLLYTALCMFNPNPNRTFWAKNWCGDSCSGKRAQKFVFFLSLLARDAASYKRPLLSDSISLAESVCLSAARLVPATSVLRCEACSVASHVAYRLVRCQVGSPPIRDRQRDRWTDKQNTYCNLL